MPHGNAGLLTECSIANRSGRIFVLDEVRELSHKINDRVVPILIAIRNWNGVICLSRSEEVAVCCSLPSEVDKTVSKVVIYPHKVRG